MIAFDTIPFNIETPGAFVEFKGNPAESGFTTQNRSVIIAQRLATGTAPFNVLVRVNSPEEANVLFGFGSMAAQMYMKYRANDKTRPVWVLPIDDAVGATAATATITVNSAASKSGTINMQIGGQDLRIGIAAGTTAANIAIAIRDAINGLTTLYVTATAAAAVVTLTAKSKGILGNALDVRWNYYNGQILPDGVGLTFSGFTGGATDPSLSAALAAIGDEPFMTYVVPYQDDANQALLDTHITDKIGAMTNSDCYAVTFKNGTFSQIQSFASAKNFFGKTLPGLKNSPTPPWEMSAAIAGALAYSQDDDPAVAPTGIELSGVLAPKETDRFTRQERQFLLEAGASTLIVNANGNLAIERIVTPYKTNTQGFVDKSYHDLNTLWCVFYYRAALRARIASKFQRFKLGRDGVNYGPGQKIMTPNFMRAELITHEMDMISKGICEDNLPEFKKTLQVEIDAQNPTQLKAHVRPNIMNQFLVFAAQIMFSR